ncbi:MAG: tRNA adenosine(34) deaminase TadA [Arsenophonus endosymbiont of Ceratovacuna japonica]
MNQIKKDIYWMQKAIFLIQNAKVKNEIPVGAILIYKNKLIAECCNNPILYNDPSAHAEILALRLGGQYLKNYRLLNTTLYVTLEPCIMCAGAIINARINRLVFGAYNKKTGAVGSIINIFNNHNINHRIIVSNGILSDQCSELLNIFFKKKRIEKKYKKILY